MTIILSEIYSQFNVPCHGQGVRLSSCADENLKECLKTRIAAALSKSKSALIERLTKPDGESLVFKCTGFRESSQALIILSSSSSIVIVPKSGVESFDYSKPIGKSIEVQSLTLIHNHYFFAASCRIYSS
jgi:hypothetical protein